MVLDTKWKKSKALKLILVLLSLVMSFTFAFSAVECMMIADCTMYGMSSEELVSLYKNGLPDFFDCRSFHMTAVDQITMTQYLYKDAEQYRDNLEKSLDGKAEEIASAYGRKKAEIIKKDLEYIAENYKLQDEGESVYNENAYSEILDSQIPETPYEEQKYLVDPYASKTVQMVQKILNYAEGEEFLKYATLVDFHSFNSGEFKHDIVSGYCFHSYDFTDTVDEIRLRAEKEIGDYIQSEYQLYQSDMSYERDQIKKYDNLKYFVRKGDKTFTNMTSPEDEISSIKTNSFYMLKENGDVTLKAGSDTSQNRWVYEVNNYKNIFDDYDEAAFYIGDNIIINGEDRIGELYSEYQSLPKRIDLTFITAFASLMILIACVVVIMIISGHKKGVDGCSTAAIDKCPADIHLALSGGLIFGAFCLGVVIYQGWDSFDKLFVTLIAGCFTIAFGILLEFITSITRLIKAKAKLFKNCITVRLVAFIFKGAKRLFKWIFRKIRNIFFSYKMKHLSKKFIFLSAAWILINVAGIFIMFLSFLNSSGFSGMLVILLLGAIDGGVIFFVAKYLRSLDKIIVAATERTSASFGGERVPESLETLNDSLKITKEEMDSAVARAVKNERTKTELITNVSHDLKTPLTSIISYVDLLKKCDIQDEDASKYIGILSDKSNNLKNLIENLIEASKASAGNIKFNKVYLNLKELAAQATGEFQSDFEARGLELRFRETDGNIRVFVDGQHTYRVLENLLSNAKKYSATGTRVYASIRREGKFGIFEIKNISKEPLDISPDELTERFVRGDLSRGTEEGNGLGLSIAKQLCTLQGGELKITIDGDLFKAEVYLPTE